MTIRSCAFGGTTFIGDDAERFTWQVRRGRAKARAVEALRRGVLLSRDLQREGVVRIKVRPGASGVVLKVRPGASGVVLKVRPGASGGMD